MYNNNVNFFRNSYIKQNISYLNIDLKGSRIAVVYLMSLFTLIIDL
jgi:hypothetical protein